MRIVFGILSSNNTDVAIQQIIDAIGSNHPIIIHHDFSKQAEFQVTGRNVHVLKDYAITSWGEWSLVDAVIKLMDYALNNIPDWDYFQLLSDTCLPIQPISKFETYLETVKPDANISCINIVNNQLVFLSHGHRAFSSKKNISYRLLRKINYWSNKLRGAKGNQMVEGLTLPIYTKDNNPVIRLFTHSLQGALLKLAQRYVNHSFANGTECYVGSQFFGCSHAVCQAIKAWMNQYPEAVTAIQEKIIIPDEFFFQTVIGNLHLAHYESTNHLINFFDSSTGHGAELQLSDFELLKASGKFFARKFSKNPDDTMRLKMLDDIKRESR